MFPPQILAPKLFSLPLHPLDFAEINDATMATSPHISADTDHIHAILRLMSVPIIFPSLMSAMIPLGSITAHYFNHRYRSMRHACILAPPRAKQPIVNTLDVSHFTQTSCTHAVHLAHRIHQTIQSSSWMQ